jgi:hypothetical protein
VRDAVINNTLFMPHALAGALSAQAQPLGAPATEFGVHAAPAAGAAASAGGPTQQLDRCVHPSTGGGAHRCGHTSLTRPHALP